MDEIVQEVTKQRYLTVDELKNIGLARLLVELAREGEAEVVETLYECDEGNIFVIEWKGKRYGVICIGNSSDWEVVTEEEAREIAKEIWEE